MKKLMTALFVVLILTVAIRPSFAQDQNQVDEYIDNVHDGDSIPVNLTINNIMPVTERVDVSGDLKLTYDYNHSPKTNDYQAFRGRIQFQTPVNNDFDIILRLNTTDVSTGVVSPRVIGFDIAQATYYGHFADINNYQLSAGKMESPFYRPGGFELLMDEDITFEGIGFAFFQNAEDYDLSVKAGYFNDVMSGIQGLINIGNITIGGGYYTYDQSTDPMAPDATRDIFAEINGNILVPLTVSGEYTKTIYGAESWMAGLKIGDLNQQPIELYENYHFVGDQSVNTRFMNREWIASEGHEVGINIALADNVIYNTRFYGKTLNADYRVISDITLCF